MKKQTLDSWIHEALVDDQKDGSCVAMTLVHIANGVPHEIYGMKFGNRQYDPTELANTFRHKAQGYCQELPGVQYFSLYAFYGKVDPDTGEVRGSQEPQAKHPFRLQGEVEFEGGFTSEEPTERGMKQQGMRLTEQLVGGSFGMIRVTFENQNQLLDKMLRLQTVTMDQNQQLIQGLQAALLQKAQENHTYRLEELKAERTNEMISKGIGMLPGIANKVLGKEVFPESQVDSNLIEMIVKDLLAHPEKVPQLQSMFPQEVWAPVMTRMVDIANRLQKVQALNAKVTKAGEEDAAGS